jgi:hypothetical protein
MPLKIEELDKPKLPRVRMQCDEPIDEKLTTVPAVNDCFSTNTTSFICGGCGSGKTTFTVQMLKGIFKGCFERIIIIIPENSFNSLSEKDQMYFRKHIPPEDIIHELSPETLEQIYEEVQESAMDGHHTLIVIDDWGHVLKDKAIERNLQRIMLKNRHLRTSIMMLVQNWYMAPKKLREVCNTVVMFNTCKSQNMKMFAELFDIKEEGFREILQLLPTYHDYLLLDLRRKQMFHNWNRVEYVPKKDN